VAVRRVQLWLRAVHVHQRSRDRHLSLHDGERGVRLQCIIALATSLAVAPATAAAPTSSVAVATTASEATASVAVAVSGSAAGAGNHSLLGRRLHQSCAKSP
jgi:hypothetical protein